MKQVYLFLHIPAQPGWSPLEEWHELAKINTCYTAFMADVVEQFRLADVKRELNQMRQLIAVTAESHDEALAIAKTKI